MVWTHKMFPSIEAFKEYIKKLGFDISNKIVLPAAKITLRPFGPKGGAVKSSLVSSLNDKGFSCVELLWLAHNLQAPHLREEQTRGVGIFRTGHEKNVPAYYIGGYYDAADFIPKED